MFTGPWPSNETQHFLDTFFYAPSAFLIDTVSSADTSGGVMRATVETAKPIAYADMQRGDPKRHPRHVSGADLLMITGNMGCLHAYFFHGCRWDEGWVGFGGKLYRVDFKALALLGAPLEVVSTELQKKVMSDRAIFRFGFEMRQGDKLVYVSEQSAMFIKNFEMPVG